MLLYFKNLNIWGTLKTKSLRQKLIDFRCQICDDFNLCKECFLGAGHEHEMDEIGTDVSG
jgi:hypothetical protein